MQRRNSLKFLVRVPTEEEINDKWEPVTIHHLVVDQKKRKMLSSSSEVDVDYGDFLDLDGQKDIAKDPSASIVTSLGLNQGLWRGCPKIFCV